MSPPAQAASAPIGRCGCHSTAGGAEWPGALPPHSVLLSLLRGAAGSPRCSGRAGPAPRVGGLPLPTRGRERRSSGPEPCYGGYPVRRWRGCFRWTRRPWRWAQAPPEPCWRKGWSILKLHSRRDLNSCLWVRSGVKLTSSGGDWSEGPMLPSWRSPRKR